MFLIDVDFLGGEARTVSRRGHDSISISLPLFIFLFTLLTSFVWLCEMRRNVALGGMLRVGLLYIDYIYMYRTHTHARTHKHRFDVVVFRFGPNWELKEKREIVPTGRFTDASKKNGRNSDDTFDADKMRLQSNNPAGRPKRLTNVTTGEVTEC